MTRPIILLLLAPLAATAQLQLQAVNGSTKTPLVSGSTYSLGQTPLGVSITAFFLAANTGAAPVTVKGLALAGAGFSIVNTPSPPYPVAPGASMTIEIQFLANAGPGAYSAALEVSAQDGSTVEVLLMATAVAAATLTSAPPCAGPDSNFDVNFGNVSINQTINCKFLLTNNSSQAITLSTVAVAGKAFLFAQAPSIPLSLPPGVSSQPFVVSFSPNAAASYSGTLTVDSQTFKLTGTAYNPPLPTPILEFDTANAQSGQQITLTMSLPTASPIAASGSVNLAFTPASGVASIAPRDPTVNFVATGARSVPFSIEAGATQAKFAGQPGAIFSTGLTAGTITFTVSTSAQLTGDPTATLTMAPMAISVDKAAATAIAGELRVQVWGFDNTYSAGRMSFRFYDNIGHLIGGGPIDADFTSNFQTYFSASPDAGGFAMLVSFPVSGNSAQVGSVDVQLMNSAGATTITNLVFLNDTGTCVLVNNVLSCPPAPTQ